MSSNYETRDYFDSRSQAAQHAQSAELPQWLRNAWQAVADGRIASPAEYREDGRMPAAGARSQAPVRKAPVVSDKARIGYLESKVQYMQDAIGRERGNNPAGRRKAYTETLVDKLLSEPREARESSATANTRRARELELKSKRR
jgi:hypothetical protein